MFFIGITIGRALNGFLAMKLSNTQIGAAVVLAR